MGVLFQSKFLVGVPWDAVVKRQAMTVPVTKYNPDTGVPYMKDVTTHTTQALGRKFAGADSATDEHVEQYLLHTLKLDVEDAGYSGDKDRRRFVGVVLTTVADRDTVADVPLTKLAAAVDAVAHTLKAHGYDGPNPALIHVMQYS